MSESVRSCQETEHAKSHPMHVNQVRALRDRALLCGAHPTSRLSARWDVFGRFDPETGEIKGYVCTRPKSISLWERPMRNAPGNPEPAGITLNVRCRGCESCRKHREVCFRRRACVEYASAARSRFLTFTFAPKHHFRADREVAKAIAVELANPTRWHTRFKGVQLEAIMTALRENKTQDLGVKEKRLLFALRVMELGKEVTLFLKRLRERSGSKIRYAMVAEAHSKKLAGRPHFHMLLHECDPSRLVRKRLIRNAWRQRVGFIKMNLTDGDSRAPSYLAKYLHKAETSRLRCSHFYGNSSPRRETSPLMGEDRPNGIVASAGNVKSAAMTPSGAPKRDESRKLLGVSLEETWDEAIAARTDLPWASDQPGLIGAPEGEWARWQDELAFKEFMRPFGPDLDFSRPLLGRRRRAH